MANESTFLGEFLCAVDEVEYNNNLLQKSGNLITVFDRHKIAVPPFDTNVHFESYSAFAKQVRFTEEEVFLDFSKNFSQNTPPINVYGFRLMFFPEAVNGIYIYSASFENGLWDLPDKGEWLDKRST